MSSDASEAPSLGSMSQYPLQRHAGKVGYGPNYNTGPGPADKVAGLVEEARGKITHNPELVRHGHEMHTTGAHEQGASSAGKDLVFEKDQDTDKSMDTEH